MRDYSFGNFISALRERRGLSQYQLGALVGVSDKAVSKWENGASKPRTDTMLKLAEILDVSVDELLTCEYAAFDRKRKDLFAMKKEIMKIAEKKMKELYGANPPIGIMNRFHTEELMLDKHEMLLWMGFLGKLCDRFCDEDLYFEIRGAQTGASFIAWLLGGTNVNPLPPHYYCPRCKKVEFAPDAKCGPDLSEKTCSCGESYCRDGFGISEINMYPLQIYNEIYTSCNATACVKENLQEYFKDYGVVRELKVSGEEEIERIGMDGIKTTRFVLFPNDIASRYPEEVMEITAEDYFDKYSQWSMLAVAENGNEDIGCIGFSKAEITSQQIDAYFRYAVENDKFTCDYKEMKFDKVLSDIMQPKFSDLIALLGFLHGTGVWENNMELLYEQGIPFEELISNREDVYAYLYDKLKGKCCENPSGVAFEIKESVRKGRYSHCHMSEETENLLLECGVPEWYVEGVMQIRYLFPKTHLVTLIKREIWKFCSKGNRKGEFL